MYKGYYHHQTKLGFIRRGPQDYLQYNTESKSPVVATANKDQKPTTKTWIPIDSIPADIYQNDQIYRFHFTNSKTVQTHYKIESEQNEWKNQLTRNIKATMELPIDQMMKTPETLQITTD
jgi:hypothetical protein